MFAFFMAYDIKKSVKVLTCSLFTLSCQFLLRGLFFTLFYFSKSVFYVFIVKYKALYVCLSADFS